MYLSTDRTVQLKMDDLRDEQTVEQKLGWSSIITDDDKVVVAKKPLTTPDQASLYSPVS